MDSAFSPLPKKLQGRCSKSDVPVSRAEIGDAMLCGAARAVVGICSVVPLGHDRQSWRHNLPSYLINNVRRGAARTEAGWK